jgi:hypothetical protein
MHSWFWWESRDVRNHKESLDAGGRIILKWFLNEYDEYELSRE